MSLLGCSPTFLWDSRAFLPLNIELRKIASILLSKNDLGTLAILPVWKHIEMIIVDYHEVQALKPHLLTTLQVNIDSDVEKVSSSSLFEW